MKDKNFLIQQGMYSECREDVYYIVGSVYDECQKNNGITKGIIKQIKNLRDYLDQNRQLIHNAKYPIVLEKSIINRLNELGFYSEKEKELKKKKSSIQIGDKNKSNFEEKTGIYGIFIADKIVYIGKTMVNFKTRFNAHKNKLEKSDELLYRNLRTAKSLNQKIEMKPLVILEDLQVEHKKTFNEKEVECMELALITAYQPIFNVEGILKPYIFRC